MCSTSSELNETPSNFKGNFLLLKYLDTQKRRRSYSLQEKLHTLKIYKEELISNGVGAIQRTAERTRIAQPNVSKWAKDESLITFQDGEGQIKRRAGAGRRKKYPAIEQFLLTWSLEQENREIPCTPKLAALAIVKKFRNHSEFEKFKGENGMTFLTRRSPL